MAGPDLVVKVAANISALQADMAKVSASIKTIETAATSTSTNASSAFGGMSSAALQLAGAFGLAFSVGQLVTWGRELMADADALTRLHDKTGISVEGLQAMRIAGDDAGVSLESMTSAVNMLQKRLGGDDASAVKALRDLGIEIGVFKALDGAQQMAALADAIKLQHDPLRVAADLSALFGKSWADQLPALKRGFDEVRDGSGQMSAGTVKALDDAGDAAARLYRSFKANLGEAMADILTLSLSATRQLESDIDRLAAAAEKAAPKVMGLAAPGLPADLDAINAKFDAQATIINERMTPAAIAFRAAMVELNAVGVGFNGTLDTIDGTVVEAIRFYLEAGVAQGTLATAYGLTAVQIKAVATAMSEELAMAKVLADFKSSAAAHQDALDTRALKVADDMIAAIFKRKEADEAFLATELKIAVAQDAANAAAGRAPAAIEPVKTALDHTTAAANAAVAAFGAFSGMQFPMMGTAPGSNVPGGGGGGVWTNPYNTGAALGGSAPIQVQRRATGGPVSSGQSYLVGERGPELFTSGSSGGITPNGGGGTTIVNVHITHPLGTPDQIVRVVGPAVIAALRNSGTRLPVGT